MAVNEGGLADRDALRRRLTAAFRGELEVGDVLGVGGFATVFRARDPVLEREVAIKVIDAESAHLADRQDQFLAEARVVATVEHPHIVPLYAAEVREGLLCLTMRLVPGRSLAERIAEGPLPPAEAIRLAREVAEALAAAHARGIVHRDIKPENVLLDANGHAIVTDFGISLVTGRSNERRPGVAIGTPQYLSPEQALGEEVDGRADVYSLGVVLYEMLTGRLPFESPTTAGLLAKQILEAPPSLESRRPDLPAAVVAAVGRALTKSAADRPTAAALVEELTKAATPQALTPPSVVRRRARWRRARWIGGTVVVLAAAVGHVAGPDHLYRWRHSRPQRLGGQHPAGPDRGSPRRRKSRARRNGRICLRARGHGWGDALLVTDRAIVRRIGGTARRHAAWGAGVDLNLTFFRRGEDRGIVVSTGKTGRPDTLYRNLSGAELGALSTAMAGVTGSDRVK